jgi:hypothetical protein
LLPLLPQNLKKASEMFGDAPDFGVAGRGRCMLAVFSRRRRSAVTINVVGSGLQGVVLIRVKAPYPQVWC